MISASARKVLGRLAAARSRWTEAEELLHDALAQRVEAGLRVHLPQTLDALAEIAAGLESYDEAARLLGATERSRADLGLVRWPPDGPRMRALADMLLAELGDEAFGAAHAEGAALTLEEAVAWIRRARGSRKRPAGGWESLTPTELQVIELAAQGLTNPQIGERMSSPARPSRSTSPTSSRSWTSTTAPSSRPKPFGANTEQPGGPMSENEVTERTPAASNAHEVVRAYFAELEAGRFDAALRHYSADAVGTLHGQFGPARREEVADYLSELRTAFPDLSFQVLDLIAENDTAAVRWRARGTFSGPGWFMGFRPTGAAFDFEALDIGQVADGKIQRLDGYADGMTIARQLGLMPPAGSTGERAMTAVLNARTLIARRRRQRRVARRASAARQSHHGQART